MFAQKVFASVQLVRTKEALPVCHTFKKNIEKEKLSHKIKMDNKLLQMMTRKVISSIQADSFEFFNIIFFVIIICFQFWMDTINITLCAHVFFL